MKIEVKNLVQQFHSTESVLSSSEDGVKRAVDDVSFSITEGEMFGLIGHSGCGKTTIARILSGLLEPMSGEVYYDGENIFEMGKKRIKAFRKEVRVIFQNPDSCLNPHMKIKEILVEVFKIHTDLNKDEINQKINSLFETIGLNPDFLQRYPHQLSIGQKRKIGLARALAIVPKFLIADEPFAGLDASTKRELTSLLKRLHENHKFGALIISHDLESVGKLCSRVAVMYKGRMIEFLYDSQLMNQEVYHPYTQMLLGGEKEGRRILILKGKFHSITPEAAGCQYINQCELYSLLDHPSLCREKRPTLKSLENDHQVACHFCDRLSSIDK
ncbi:MAG TPA: ABC transporter ATP-binding protein [candidate division Zixibacteria bacterium]